MLPFMPKMAARFIRQSSYHPSSGVKQRVGSSAGGDTAGQETADSTEEWALRIVPELMESTKWLWRIGERWPEVICNSHWLSRSGNITPGTSKRSSQIQQEHQQHPLQKPHAISFLPWRRDRPWFPFSAHWLRAILAVFPNQIHQDTTSVLLQSPWELLSRWDSCLNASNHNNWEITRQLINSGHFVYSY